MKIAVINFSGNVGKSTVARHLLMPRVEGADLISVGGFGARLRYVQCPQAPFIDSTEQNVCEGK